MPIKENGNGDVLLEGVRVIVRNKELHISQHKGMLRLNVRGIEGMVYPLSLKAARAFTIGELGKVDVNYNDPIEVLNIYIRKLKHAQKGKGDFEHMWAEGMEGTDYDFPPTVLVKMVERGFIPFEDKKKMLRVIRSRFFSKGKDVPWTNPLWASKKVLEMGIYDEIDKEIAAAEEKIEEIRTAPPEPEPVVEPVVEPEVSAEPEKVEVVAGEKIPEEIADVVADEQIINLKGYRVTYKLMKVEPV